MKKLFSVASGFTLIEMMVVIAIIAILASIFLVGLGGFRSSAYDTRRISDLQHVQSYLELYYNSTHQYPASLDYSALGTDLVAAGIGVTALPQDPQYSNGTGDYVYKYTQCTSGQGYILAAAVTKTASVISQIPGALKAETCAASWNSACGTTGPLTNAGLALYCGGE